MSTVFRVNKTDNYTVMSNYHLRDKRLSHKAKGILSEMLSLPPDWDYTLAGLATLAADGVGSVRSGINELEKYGYLQRRRNRDQNGRLTNSEYLVFERPEENPDYESTENKGKSPICKNPTLVNPTLVNPTLENPTLDNPTQENPMLENPTQLNTNILNTKKLNTQSYQSEVSELELTDTSDEIDMIDNYRSLICDNISYDTLKKQCSKSEVDMINEIVEIMVECVCSRKKTVRIGGEEKLREIVKSRFLKINSTHIEYILTCLRDNTSDVKNIRSYLLTTIYNAPATIENYYTAKVNHDLYGSGELKQGGGKQ